MAEDDGASAPCPETQDASDEARLITQGWIHDVTKPEITFREMNGHMRHLRPGPDLCVLRGGQRVSVSELRAGIRVQVTYSVDQGESTLHEARILDAAPMRSATPRPEPMVPQTPRPPETK